MISLTVRARKSMSKDISHTTKAASKKGKNKDKESTNGIKNNIIQESSKITKSMVSDSMSVSSINTRESFVTEKNKEKAHCIILIKIGPMKGNLKTI